MGQAESNVTSGVKKQAGTSTQALYKFVNLKGGGLLVDMMKRASQSKQYAEIDHAIKTKVKYFQLSKLKTPQNSEDSQETLVKSGLKKR